MDHANIFRGELKASIQAEIDYFKGQIMGEAEAFKYTSMDYVTNAFGKRVSILKNVRSYLCAQLRQHNLKQIVADLGTREQFTLVSDKGPIVVSGDKMVLPLIKFTLDTLFDDFNEPSMSMLKIYTEGADKKTLLSDKITVKFDNWSIQYVHSDIFTVTDEPESLAERREGSDGYQIQYKIEIRDDTIREVQATLAQKTEQSKAEAEFNQQYQLEKAVSTYNNSNLLGDTPGGRDQAEFLRSSTALCQKHSMYPFFEHFEPYLDAEKNPTLPTPLYLRMMGYPLETADVDTLEEAMVLQERTIRPQHFREYLANAVQICARTVDHTYHTDPALRAYAQNMLDRCYTEGTEGTEGNSTSFEIQRMLYALLHPTAEEKRPRPSIFFKTADSNDCLELIEEGGVTDAVEAFYTKQQKSLLLMIRSVIDEGFFINETITNLVEFFRHTSKGVAPTEAFRPPVTPLIPTEMIDKYFVEGSSQIDRQYSIAQSISAEYTTKVATINYATLLSDHRGELEDERWAVLVKTYEVYCKLYEAMVEEREASGAESVAAEKNDSDALLKDIPCKPTRCSLLKMLRVLRKMEESGQAASRKDARLDIELLFTVYHGPNPKFMYAFFNSEACEEKETGFLHPVTSVDTIVAKIKEKITAESVLLMLKEDISYGVADAETSAGAADAAGAAGAEMNKLEKKLQYAACSTRKTGVCQCHACTFHKQQDDAQQEKYVKSINTKLAPESETVKMIPLLQYLHNKMDGKCKFVMLCLGRPVATAQHCEGMRRGMQFAEDVASTLTKTCDTPADAARRALLASVGGGGSRRPPIAAPPRHVSVPRRRTQRRAPDGAALHAHHRLYTQRRRRV